MLSARYQAIGWGADARIGNDVSMNVRNVVSNALDDGVNGMQISAALTLPLSHSIAASLSTTRQTLGYRDFSDTLVRSDGRSEEHTSELQSLMRTSYAVFCLKK